METVHQTHVHVISVSHMLTAEVMMLLYGPEFLLISASVSLRPPALCLPPSLIAP